MAVITPGTLQGSVQIPGPPGAARVADVAAHIHSGSAQSLRSLQLHKKDLEHCDAALATLLDGRQMKWDVVEISLFESALVKFIACFGTAKARQSLSGVSVYKGLPEQKAAFEHFYKLRDKHVVHDENYFRAVTLIAYLDGSDQPIAIAKRHVSAAMEDLKHRVLEEIRELSPDARRSLPDVNHFQSLDVSATRPR